MPETAPTSPPISERELERSMNLNIAAGFLGSIWVAAWNGLPLPLLMRAVEATGFQLGLLAGVRQFAMLAQLPSALLVEGLGRRKPFWATVAIIHRALWYVPVLLPWLLPDRRDLWPIVIIAALGVSDVLGNASTAPWFSWMADLLPPGRAGRFWGARQRILSTSVLLAALAFGLVLDAFANRGFLGFQIVFAVAATFGIGDILVHMFVHEPLPERAHPDEARWRRIVAPLQSRDFRRLTLGMGAWTAAVAMPGYANGLPTFFGIVYLKEAFGVSYAQASWVFVASAIGAILWTPRIGHTIDHRGARRTILLLMKVGPLCTLAWLFVSPMRFHLGGSALASVPQPIVLIGAVSLIVGGVYMGVTLCQMRLTQVLTSGTGRTVAMGLHWSLVGLLGSLGPLAAGWIKDHFPGPGIVVASWLAPISYFQVLVLIQVALAWLVAYPLIRSIVTSDVAEEEAGGR